MTAGHGIAHAEDTAGAPGAALHGLQLWVALPDASRDSEPAFAHHGDLPVLDLDGVRATVLIGELGGARSDARAFTPLVGAELRLAPGSTTTLPLDAAFEHALLAVDGDVQVDGRTLDPAALAYLGTGRVAVPVASGGGGRAFLIGGTPLGEPLVMWWNFVGRSHEDVVAARADWEAGLRFAPVPGYGERLTAPALPNIRLLPR